jgi:protein SCO1/2
MTPRAVRLSLIFAAFAASLLTVFAAILIVSGRVNAPAIPAVSAIGGPFQLTDHNGRPITEAELKGRPHLIFFGFTNCPDVCPTALFEISEILRALGPDADKAGALFVTVDPERDTPEKLKDYISSFHPRLTGVTGKPEDVERMLKAYRVYFRKVPTDSGYTMDHTALVYLMDKQGRFVAPFSLKRRPEEAAADLRKYI